LYQPDQTNSINVSQFGFNVAPACFGFFLFASHLLSVIVWFVLAVSLSYIISIQR